MPPISYKISIWARNVFIGILCLFCEYWLYVYVLWCRFMKCCILYVKTVCVIHGRWHEISASTYHSIIGKNGNDTGKCKKIVRKRMWQIIRFTAEFSRSFTLAIQINITLLPLFWKNKRGLMRTLCCLRVSLNVWKAEYCRHKRRPFRQWLDKNFPRQTIQCNNRRNAGRGVFYAVRVV
jgi:hypothetical protein